MYDHAIDGGRAFIDVTPFLSGPDSEAPAPPTGIGPLPTSTDTPVPSSGTTISIGHLAASAEWTMAGSPYYVTQNLLVPAGITLTIDAGVQVLFDPNTGMQVNGSLVAQGQAGQPVVFGPADGSTNYGDWQGITFLNAQPAVFDPSGNYTGGSMLDYAQVLYAGASYGWGIAVYSSSPYIANTTVEYSSGNGMYEYFGSPVLANDTLSNNSGDGFYLGGYGSATISGSTMDGNSGTGMYAGMSCAWCDQIVTVRDDSFYNNQQGGFHEDSNWNDVTITGSNFINNANQPGLYLTWPSTLLMDGNTISATQNTPGLMFYAGGPATVTNNDIENNNNPSGSWNGAGAAYANFTGSGQVFSDNVISGNVGTDGAALYLDYSGSNLQIDGNLFAEQHCHER